MERLWWRERWETALRRDNDKKSRAQPRPGALQDECVWMSDLLGGRRLFCRRRLIFRGLPLLWLMWRNERLLLTDWRWRIISTLARRGTRLALHGEGALCSTGRTFCWGSGLHGLVSVTGGTKEKERVRD